MLTLRSLFAANMRSTVILNHKSTLHIVCALSPLQSALTFYSFDDRKGGDRERPDHWISVLKSASDSDDALEALRTLTPAIKAYANRSDFVLRFGDLDGMSLMVRALSLGVDDDELRTAFLMAIKA